MTPWTPPTTIFRGFHRNSTLYVHILLLIHPRLIHLKSLNIFTSIFKTVKGSMNQIVMQLGVRLITPYTHILTMISNTVYLKMLPIAII